MALRVDLNGTGTGFKHMLDTARVQAKAFATSVTEEVGSSWGGLGKSFASGIAGIFAVEGVKRTLEWFVDTGKEIKETAEQVDMSTESWQKWAEAVDKAGLSTTSFQRIVETLREKRTAALTDPKARGELSRLGFSDADITGEMDMGEFTRRALANANGGDLQRKYLSDVIGQRGLKYATAIPNLGSAEALFSEEDLKQAGDAAQKLRTLGKIGDKIKIEAVETALSEDPAATFTTRMTERVLGWLGVKPRKHFRGAGAAGSWEDDQLSPQDKQFLSVFGPGGIAALGQSDATDAQSQLSQEVRPADPMEAVLKQQKFELEQHEQERQQRLMDSQLGLMTIGSRRAAIMADAEKLRKQIAERQAKMNGEDFLTDAERDQLTGVTGRAREVEVNKIRAKYQDQTTDLQIRSNRDIGELRQKPLDFKADTMQGVGLYQASALVFNPVLGIMEKQTQVLEQIARNTAPQNGARNHLEP